MRKLLYTAALLVASAFGAKAQMSVEAPGVVDLNEQFNVSFVLTEKASSFEWTPGDDFQLVWGPQTGSSTSISIVNGKTTRSSQYTYTYVLLPRSAGKFSLPAAHAVVGGKDVYSKAPSIEVVGSSQQASRPTAQQPTQSSPSTAASPSASQTARDGSDMFMRFTLSRTNVVVGEPITASLKLYTRGGISGFEDARFPKFDGFWAQETFAPQNIEFQRENYNDRIYNTAVLRTWVLIPQKSGTISIDPAELVCLVQQRVSTGNSIFDGFFDDYHTVRRRVISESYKVNVSQLPAGAPASFTGAVGSYRISAALSSDSLKVHDAACLTITISGKGNVALVGAPKVKFAPDSEVYDTKTSEKIDRNGSAMSGSKVFEYPFIPRSYGDFEIPAVEFSYYDISARKYVTISTPPIPYNVARGEETNYVSPDGVGIPVASRRDVKNLAEDIHYITTRMPALSSEGTFFVGTGLFWLLAGLIAVLAIVVYAVVKAVRRRRGDVVGVKVKSASKVARKRLAVAAGYMAKNLHSAFYEELHKALLGYASDKMNIGAADLNKDDIAAAFVRGGAPEALAAEYVAILDQCEFARYAPEGGSQTLQETYDKAMTLISTIDGYMKKTRKGAKGTAVAIMLLATCATNLGAQPRDYVDSLWNAAVAAYGQDDFASAERNFTAIEALGLGSPELYTNIADCCYKQRKVGSSILYYERALRLDPSFKDAKYNIGIARSLCQDRIEVIPEFFLKSAARNVCYSLPSNVWAGLFLGFFALALALLVLFLLSEARAWRMTGFFGSIVAAILSVAMLVNAAWQKSEYERKDAAVVMRAVSSVKSAPSLTSGSDLFILHEGTRVRVLDNVGDWTRVVLSDGREGWLSSRDITLI